MEGFCIFVTMESHAFHPQSRVWVYTASRSLKEHEIARLEERIAEFCQSWTAHNQQLHAGGYIAYDRMVVLVVDESKAGASGCSIDKSVHFLEAAGHHLNCDFFIRNLVGIKQDDSWEWMDFRQVSGMLSKAKIYPHTIVIDSLVNDFESLQSIEKPLAESWLSRYLKDDNS